MDAGDLNGDGRPDLAVGTGSGVAILLANGDARFLSAPAFRVKRNPFALTLGSFDGDSMVDLAVIANSQDDGARGFVSILMGSGPDRFRNAGDIPAGDDPRGIATADFNEDGIADLAVVGQRNDSRNVEIALGNGNATFRPGLVTSVPNFPEFVASADFNMDGHADLAIGAETSADAVQLTVRLGLGDGSFGHRITRLGGALADRPCDHRRQHGRVARCRHRGNRERLRQGVDLGVHGRSRARPSARSSRWQIWTLTVASISPWPRTTRTMSRS